jgi:hypothetical protein
MLLTLNTNQNEGDKAFRGPETMNVKNNRRQSAHLKQNPKRMTRGGPRTSVLWNAERGKRLSS